MAGVPEAADFREMLTHDFSKFGNYLSCQPALHAMPVKC
jgi:hypothetical protein